MPAPTTPCISFSESSYLFRDIMQYLLMTVPVGHDPLGEPDLVAAPDHLSPLFWRR